MSKHHEIRVIVLHQRDERSHHLSAVRIGKVMAVPQGLRERDPQGLSERHRGVVFGKSHIGRQRQSGRIVVRQCFHLKVDESSQTAPVARRISRAPAG
jgi:hypothetical protein